MREAGKKQLIIGLVIAGIGLAISLGSYVAAASSSGGGSYLLLWGLVIVGLVRAFRGFSMMRAAGTASPTAIPSAAASSPPPMPAMPPQPDATAAPAPQIATEPSEPAPTSPPTSMWD
jgi:hypothetical protein